MQKNIFFLLVFFGILKVNDEIAGSGSISQRQGSADSDPDPHQNVMDPEHWSEQSEVTIYRPVM